MAVETIRYVNPGSTAGGDGTTSALTGANRAYISLNAWDAARARNLVTADEYETVICATSGAADTAICTLGAWTTDATRYVTIRADAAHRAGTEWDASKYRMSYADASIAGILTTTTAKYCRISGLQVEGSVSSLEAPQRDVFCLKWGGAPGTDGVDHRVDGCHIRIVGTFSFDATGYYFAIFANPSTPNANPAPNFKHWNNVLSFEATGNYSGSSCTAIQVEHRTHNVYNYNNTIRGGWLRACDGDDNDSKLHYCKNNLISGATAAFDANYQSSRCGYNATNLASLGYSGGTGDRVSQTFTFVSSTDHALAAGDAGAKDYGLTDPGGGLFSDDILGTTRSAPWDIGAHEYVAAGGGGAYTQSVGGSLTLSGLGSKQVSKVAAGLFSSAGTMNRRTDKQIVGSSVLAGALARSTSKQFIGGVSPGGDSDTTLLYTRSTAGSITPSGGITKQTLKAAAGLFSSAGTMNRRTDKQVASGITSIGTTSRRTHKQVAGNTIPSGAITTGATLLKSIAGILSVVSGTLNAVKLLPPTISSAAGRVLRLMGTMFNRR